MNTVRFDHNVALLNIRGRDDAAGAGTSYPGRSPAPLRHAQPDAAAGPRGSGGEGEGRRWTEPRGAPATRGGEGRARSRKRGHGVHLLLGSVRVETRQAKDEHFWRPVQHISFTVYTHQHFFPTNLHCSLHPNKRIIRKSCVLYLKTLQRSNRERDSKPCVMTRRPRPPGCSAARASNAPPCSASGGAPPRRS